MSFDHFVGQRQQSGRDFQTSGFGGFQVKDEGIAGRLLHETKERRQRLLPLPPDTLVGAGSEIQVGLSP
jgi:hypothetical protein